MIWFFVINFIISIIVIVGIKKGIIKAIDEDESNKQSSR